jgi:hypothetical protein
MRYGSVLAFFLLPAVCHADERPVDCDAPNSACVGVKAGVSFRAQLYIGPQPRTFRGIDPQPLPPPLPPPPPPYRAKDHGFAGLTGSLLLLPGAHWSPGVGGSFRVRGAPALALDLGLHRADYRDVERRRQEDTLLSLSAFLYPFSRGPLQPYGVVGVTYDWARVGSAGAATGGDWRHVGGAAGLGVEAFMTPRFSFFTDVRGLIRTRSGGDPGPEFRQDGRSTDTSIGAVVLVGMAFYAFGN